MKSFLEFYSQIKEDAMDAANPAMQAPQAPTMQNVRPAPAMAKRLQPQPPAGQQQQAGQAPTGQQDGNDPEQEQKLKSMLGSNYQSFVNALGANIKDPKFLNFLKAGLKDGKQSNDDKVNFAEISPKCSDLKPTQNEIDIDKSLSFPLKKTPAAVLTGYFKGGTHAPGGKIITCGGGKFIIDGHHRWSEVYCLNPSAKILSLDLSDVTDPFDALKYTQLGIAAVTGKTPISHGGGTNMLIACKKDIFKYISDNIKPDVVEVFVNKRIIKDSSVYQEKVLQIQEYIWSNISRMRMYNKPITNAPSREIMPQTDGAPNWMQNIPFV